MRDNSQQTQPHVELWNVVEVEHLFLIAHPCMAKTSRLLCLLQMTLRPFVDTDEVLM